MFREQFAGRRSVRAKWTIAVCMMMIATSSIPASADSRHKNSPSPTASATPFSSTPTPSPTAAPTPTATPSPSPTATPTPGSSALNGVYDLSQFNSAIPNSILNNSSVDGISIRVTGWNVVEPSEGVFDWSKVDAMIAQAPNKKLEITIPAGYTTPQWVYDDGALSYSWIWDQAWGAPICSVTKMPLPWDPVFQSKWAALVAAFGARYDSNPKITNIKLTGPNNSQDAELWLPHKGIVGIGTGSTSCNGGAAINQCCSYNNDQDWINAKYTRTKLEDAMTWDISQFDSAFPDKPFTIETDPCSIPAIDENGNFFSSPGNCGDEQGVNDVVNTGINFYGRGRFIVQNDGLQQYPYTELAQWWTVMQADSAYVDVGFQFAYAMGTADFAGVSQTGIDDGAKFIEFYQSDLTNAGNAAAIASIHQQLLAK
jgi:glycosyl hydrolase family 42 (putative beta-galactosidase)